MQKQVYLCGPITYDPISWTWRKEAWEFFFNRGIKALDPLRGQDFASTSENGSTSNIPRELSVERDILDIINSDAVLCNFIYIPDRQMTGSFMELGICVALHKPFIVATTDPELQQHPFITELSVQVLDDLEEAQEAVAFLVS
jgi:nucleoside 2-deoxyribosyltransferase